MSSKIIKAPNKILEIKSKVVDRRDKDTMEIVGAMLEAVLKEENAVGISAIQIGVPRRIILLGFQKGQICPITKDNFIVLINPIVVNKSDVLKDSVEGCLSVPNKEVIVKRSESIEIKYTDLNWHRRSWIAKDFNAFALQHELDHLDGKLMCPVEEDKELIDLGDFTRYITVDNLHPSVWE